MAVGGASAKEGGKKKKEKEKATKGAKKLKTNAPEKEDEKVNEIIGAAAE